MAQAPSKNGAKRKPGIKRGRPTFKPTAEQRKHVKAMVGFGIPLTDISNVVGIAPNTLTKHFAHEIATGAADANAEVAGALFKNAVKKGNVAAQIFWLKTKAGWVQPEQHEVNLAGTVNLEGASERLFDKVAALAARPKTNGASQKPH